MSYIYNLYIALLALLSKLFTVGFLKIKNE